MKQEIDIFLTPKEVAQTIWCLDDTQQAEMFSELLRVAGSEHTLMMQFLACRDRCKENQEEGGKALDAFQAMFSSAFKWVD